MKVDNTREATANFKLEYWLYICLFQINLPKQHAPMDLENNFPLQILINFPTKLGCLNWNLPICNRHF